MNFWNMEKKNRTLRRINAKNAMNAKEDVLIDIPFFYLMELRY